MRGALLSSSVAQVNWLTFLSLESVLGGGGDICPHGFVAHMVS